AVQAHGQLESCAGIGRPRALARGFTRRRTSPGVRRRRDPGFSRNLRDWPCIFNNFWGSVAIFALCATHGTNGRGWMETHVRCWPRRMPEARVRREPEEVGRLFSVSSGFVWKKLVCG